MAIGDFSFSLRLGLHQVIFYTLTCQRMAQCIGVLHPPLENSAWLNLHFRGCPADPSRQMSGSCWLSITLHKHFYP